MHTYILTYVHPYMERYKKYEIKKVVWDVPTVRTLKLIKWRSNDNVRSPNAVREASVLKMMRLWS